MGCYFSQEERQQVARERHCHRATRLIESFYGLVEASHSSSPSNPSSFDGAKGKKDDSSSAKRSSSSNSSGKNKNKKRSSSSSKRKASLKSKGYFSASSLRGSFHKPEDSDKFLDALVAAMKRLCDLSESDVKSLLVSFAHRQPNVELRRCLLEYVAPKHHHLLASGSLSSPSLSSPPFFSPSPAGSPLYGSGTLLSGGSGGGKAVGAATRGAGGGGGGGGAGSPRGGGGGRSAFPIDRIRLRHLASPESPAVVLANGRNVVAGGGGGGPSSDDPSELPAFDPRSGGDGHGRTSIQNDRYPQDLVIKTVDGGHKGTATGGAGGGLQHQHDRNSSYGSAIMVSTQDASGNSLVKARSPNGAIGPSGGGGDAVVRSGASAGSATIYDVVSLGGTHNGYNNNNTFAGGGGIQYNHQSNVLSAQDTENNLLSSIIQTWIRFDKDSSGTMSSSELKHLITAMNFPDVLKHTLNTLKDKKIAGLQQSGGHHLHHRSHQKELTFREFQEIFSSLYNFEELFPYWLTAQGLSALHGAGSYSRTSISLDALKKFFKSYQKQPLQDTYVISNGSQQLPGGGASMGSATSSPAMAAASPSPTASSPAALQQQQYRTPKTVTITLEQLIERITGHAVYTYEQAKAHHEAIISGEDGGASPRVAVEALGRVGEAGLLGAVSDVKALIGAGLGIRSARKAAAANASAAGFDSHVLQRPQEPKAELLKLFAHLQQHGTLRGLVGPDAERETVLATMGTTPLTSNGAGLGGIGGKYNGSSTAASSSPSSPYITGGKTPLTHRNRRNSGISQGSSGQAQSVGTRGGGTVTTQVSGANSVWMMTPENAERVVLDQCLFITQEQFIRLLTSQEFNSGIDPEHRRIRHEELDEPLCNYFINSSHNTYLTGDQLTSKSDPKMYKDVLDDGCRCVELDCWEDGYERDKDGKEVPKIIIYHGYTQTTRISFEEVIHAINTHAFTSSDYPVTLSFEMHVGEAHQTQMAKIMREVFGDKLCYPQHGTGGPPIKTVAAAVAPLVNGGVVNTANNGGSAAGLAANVTLSNGSLTQQATSTFVPTLYVGANSNKNGGCDTPTLGNNLGEDMLSSTQRPGAATPVVLGTAMGGGGSNTNLTASGTNLARTSSLLPDLRSVANLSPHNHHSNVSPVNNASAGNLSNGGGGGGMESLFWVDLLGNCTPESLRGKIIVKAKRITQTTDGNEVDDSVEDEDDEDVDDDDDELLDDLLRLEESGPNTRNNEDEEKEYKRVRRGTMDMSASQMGSPSPHASSPTRSGGGGGILAAALGSSSSSPRGHRGDATATAGIAAVGSDGAFSDAHRAADQIHAELAQANQKSAKKEQKRKKPKHSKMMKSYARFEQHKKAEQKKEEGGSGGAENGAAGSGGGGGHNKKKISPDMNRMTVMEAIRVKVHFDVLSYYTSSFRSSSRDEVKSLTFASKTPYIELNKYMMSRVYPHARRIDSSNFNPMRHWAYGCQLVALNWQKKESYELRLNKFKFLFDNANCGFIRKPAAFRQVVVREHQLILPSSPSDPSTGPIPILPYGGRGRILNRMQLLTINEQNRRQIDSLVPGLTSVFDEESYGATGGDGSEASLHGGGGGGGSGRSMAVNAVSSAFAKSVRGVAAVGGGIVGGITSLGSRVHRGISVITGTGTGGASSPSDSNATTPRRSASAGGAAKSSSDDLCALGGTANSTDQHAALIRERSGALPLEQQETLSFLRAQRLPTALVEHPCEYNRITVTAISAFQLPKPNRSERGEIVDPYVFAYLEGPDLPCNARGERLKTMFLNDNGFHPVWPGQHSGEANAKYAKFSTATFRLGETYSKAHGNQLMTLERHWECSMLVLQIYDYDYDTDDFLCEVMVPVKYLRQGIRCFPLYDVVTKPLAGAFLMCDIRFSYE